jgi:hypothetical protein
MKRVAKVCWRIVLGVFVGLELDTVLTGAFWGIAHGGVWYNLMTGPLHIKDYDISAGTAVLIGATAYFERSHAQRTAKKVHDHVEALFYRILRERDLADRISEDRTHLRTALIGIRQMTLTHRDYKDRGEEFQGRVQTAVDSALDISAGSDKKERDDG